MEIKNDYQNDVKMIVLLGINCCYLGNEKYDISQFNKV
jgi:hypothetical protein